MRVLGLLLPIFVGLFTVLQGGLNRIAMMRSGLAQIVALNGAMLFVAALVFLGLRGAGEGGGGLGEFRLWHLAMGLLGFGIVAGIPILIPRIGALGVFVGVIVGQLCGSLAWDLWIEGKAWDWARSAGAGLALLGAWLVMR